MFIDKAEIFVKAGSGGKGCVSFRRERHVPRGGPDGGKGGNGGDVIIKSSSHLRTLLDFRYRRSWQAGNGENGKSARRTGKNGRSLSIEVPLGTLVKKKGNHKFYDLVKNRKEIIIARGGRGGRGNAAFVTSTQRAPRVAEKGKPGEEKTIELELKLIADIGLVGCPNAGKSTFLSRVTRAKPKVAGYPFTTLRPYLGIVSVPSLDNFVLADIPGLLKGAHQGIGLGDEFLRHIERTRMLIYLIDIAGVDGRDPAEDFFTLRNELKSYKVDLTERPFFIGLNKIDMAEGKRNVSLFKKKVKEKSFPLSALTGEGVPALIKAAGKKLEEYKGNN